MLKGVVGVEVSDADADADAYVVPAVAKERRPACRATRQSPRHSQPVRSRTRQPRVVSCRVVSCRVLSRLVSCRSRGDAAAVGVRLATGRGRLIILSGRQRLLAAPSHVRAERAAGPDTMR